MDDEDYKRIASEFGEDVPKKMGLEEDEKPQEEEKPQKVKPLEEKKKELVFVKIKNGFWFGVSFAIGFWIVTILLGAAGYFILTYFNLF